MYQFDLFQQNGIDSADLHGNEERRSFAVAPADAAARRDQPLKLSQTTTGKPAGLGAEPGPGRADHLAGLKTAFGPAAVLQFHATQVAEYESAVSLLKKCLTAPDDPAVGDFAAAELPAMRAQLRDASAALADK